MAKCLLGDAGRAHSFKNHVKRTFKLTSLTSGKVQSLYMETQLN